MNLQLAVSYANNYDVSHVARNLSHRDWCRPRPQPLTSSPHHHETIAPILANSCLGVLVPGTNIYNFRNTRVGGSDRRNQIPHQVRKRKHHGFNTTCYRDPNTATLLSRLPPKSLPSSLLAHDRRIILMPHNNMAKPRPSPTVCIMSIIVCLYVAS